MVGIVSPREAWQALIEDEKAHLCDVRTEYEWDTIGVPDLSSIGKDVILIPWQPHPGRPHVNPNFVEDLGDAGLSPEHHIIFYLPHRRALAGGCPGGAGGRFSARLQRSGWI